MTTSTAMVQEISIHAPREGGDDTGLDSLIICPLISIHAPREGGNVMYNDGRLEKLVFQSTPPARGATGSCCDIWHS